MATFSKFDLSSGSPDRPLSGSQHGSHLAPQLGRLGSFRESMENPILSSLPNMTRSSSVVARGDVKSFLQCLRFDPKEVAAKHKSTRQGDLKRIVTAALVFSTDDSPSGSLKSKVLSYPLPEDIKRIKAGLCVSSDKARERVNIFDDALSVLNKFFPSIPSKKRSRSEGFSNERHSAVLSSDRSVLGSSLGKMGIQNHAVTNGFEIEQQKSDERTKNGAPNKRTRTSLDVRSNSLVRPSGTVDRDRELMRLANSGAVQGEDRTLPVGIDGWEKTKMKKKRSGIKLDASSTASPTRPIDGYREPKQGMQQRHVTDTRSRLSSDSQGLRSGAVNGTVGVGKSDAMSQPTGLSMRSFVPSADLDNCSLLNDRREHPTGSDKERVNLRAVNKTNVRDDFNSASPTSSTKMNASIRAPRSGSGIAPKLSPVVQRATAPNDWELSNCTNKPHAGGTNNRKRTASNRSSSPPVAQWAGQRPQKISRTARRSNLTPIVSNNDKNPALDTVSDASGNEVGLGFVKRLSSNSPQQVKLKGEPVSSAALSESEESGGPDIKSKDKGKKSDEIDEKATQQVHKLSNVALQSRKNKLVTGEDLGDGVRRQGRTGRGFTLTRSLMPMTVEKLGNVGTAKQLRSAKRAFEKNESKAGRPPTRKLSDRKAYARQKHAMVNSAADFPVGSDDGHQELLTAASAVINPAHALSSSFWRQMEPFFGFISDIDIAYLKQQGNLDSTAPSPAPVSSDVNSFSTLPNGSGLIEHEREVVLATETRSFKLLQEQLVPGEREIPLFQRLIAAIISEEDSIIGNGGCDFDAYGTGLEMDSELGTNCLNDRDNFLFSGCSVFNDYKMTGKTENDEAEVDVLDISSMDTYSNFVHSANGELSYLLVQYDNMPIDEKLRLEVQSIGIIPESLCDMQMDDGGISRDISKLEEKYRERVSKKKDLLVGLLKSVTKAKELQEKEFELRAHDELITMAYQKFMTCWGPYATSGKSSSNKMAKQAALACVKRTLELSHQYENTGRSCFSEPLFRDMFLSGSSQLSGARSLDTPMEGELANMHANASSRSMEARVTASLMSSEPSPRSSLMGQNGDSNATYSFDHLPPVNHSSEQATDKEGIWSHRVKKRELLLDDDVGSTIPSTPSGIGGSLSSSTKGKRSERDREGKGHNREVLSRNGTNKIGRPALSAVKGERKSKTKPKQKTTQLSASVNGLLGKIPEQPKPILPSDAKSSEITSTSNAKKKDGFGLDALDDPNTIDLSKLQLPGIDVLDSEQEQDLGSWLNIEDDGLQDDFMGLQIPMDDLSDLNMMV